jgi:hypothetical protein
VSENPGIDVAESEDYFSLSVAIDAAKKVVGEMLDPEAFASKEYVNGLAKDIREELKEISEDSKVLYVTIEQSDDGTFNADKSVEIIDAELQNGRLIKALVMDNGEQVAIPLIGIIEEETAFYSGFGAYSNYINISQNDQNIAVIFNEFSDNDQQQAVLYVPQELTDEQKAQARKNINSNQSFMLEFTVEEAGVTSVIIPLPADLYKTVIFNIHGTYPNAETEFEILGDFGGRLVGMGKIPAGETPGSNFFGLKQMGIYHMTHSAVSAISNVAKFGAANSSTAIPEGTTSVTIRCRTENTTFPVGTTFEIWGVYDE